MGQIKTFRDLIAWQRGMELAQRTYQATVRMPKEERFGLTNQMRRAAVSVSSNIAEGYARQSTIDYIRFRRVARGSLAELTTQLDLATNLQMLPPDQQTVALIDETERVLQGLIRSLENKPRQT